VPPFVIPAKAGICRLAKVKLIPRSGKENPPPLRDFLKIVGSNFCLTDRNLLFAYTKPFCSVAKTEGVLDWRCTTAEIRTFFQGSLEEKCS